MELSCTGEDPLLVALSPEVDKDDYLGDFLLAAPGACGTTVSCGWVVLSGLVDAGKSTVFQVLTARVPIRVDVPEFSRMKDVTFHAELRDATGSEVLTEEGDVLSADLSVKFSSSCP